MPDLRVALNEGDFRRLVAGRIVEFEATVRGTQVWVQVALSDIGWDAMTLALRDAIEAHNAGERRPADDIFAGAPPAAGGAGDPIAPPAASGGAGGDRDASDGDGTGRGAGG